MTPQAIRRCLLDEPNKPKEIRMNDGTRLTVQKLEQWAIGADILVVMFKGLPYHLAFRNISCIRTMPASSGRRSRTA